MKLQDSETEKILEEYKPIVRAKAKLYRMLGADDADMIQEGMIGLFNAIRTYDPDGGASFKTYADICVGRQMLTAMRTASRLKNAPLNESVSLETPIDGELTLGDTLVAGKESDPESSVIFGDMEKLLLSGGAVLTELERSILSNLMLGKSYKEIADLLGKPVKSIDNGVQRIRTKLKKYFTD